MAKGLALLLGGGSDSYPLKKRYSKKSDAGSGYRGSSNPGHYGSSNPGSYEGSKRGYDGYKGAYSSGERGDVDDDYMHDEDMDGGMEMAGREIMEGMRNDDPKKIAMAVKNLYRMYKDY